MASNMTVKQALRHMHQLSETTVLTMARMMSEDEAELFWQGHWAKTPLPD